MSSAMKKVLFLVLIAWQMLARAGELTIEITGGTQAALPIAVVPFHWSGSGAAPENVSGIIAADLQRTGRFRPLPEKDLLARPYQPDQVDFRDWRALGPHYLVIGDVRSAASGFEVSFTLFDVFRGEQLLGMALGSAAKDLRFTAHRIADLIYEKLTGMPGAFASRIAYVTAVRQPDGSQRSALRVADSDGHNPQTIVASSEPIMSPAWSPDGNRIAYVSFENKQPAVYIQELSSGRRERIGPFPGLNSAPSWAPDGRQLAVTLSKDGNPEIYTIDLGSRQLRRLTDSPSIDTEPAWSPDGGHIVFTSDRGGGPQLYRMSASGGAPQRITFQNDYNARARFSPDGKKLALVTRENGRFRIAVMDVNSGSVQTLSDGGLDESPSFAPNGSMVIYGTQAAGREVLAAVSVDGSMSQRISIDSGSLREPAWSPIKH